MRFRETAPNRGWGAKPRVCAMALEATSATASVRREKLITAAEALDDSASDAALKRRSSTATRFNLTAILIQLHPILIQLRPRGKLKLYAALVIFLCRCRKIKIRKLHFLRPPVGQIVQGRSDDGVVRNLLLVAIFEDQQGAGLRGDWLGTFVSTLSRPIQSGAVI